MITRILSNILLLAFYVTGHAQDSTFTVMINKNDYVQLDFRIVKDGDIFKEINYSVHADDNVVLTEKTIDLSNDNYVHYVVFDDYNFDGYLDMYLHDPCMVLGNCIGMVYLFKDGGFVHATQFDDMTTVSADPEKKLIYSSNRSAAGSLFTYETFRWDAGILKLIKRISQNYDGDFYLYTIEELDSKGNLKIVKQERLSEPRLE